MAVLSDHELWALLESGRLSIEPPPASDAVSPSTIDLTLGNKFARPKSPGGSATETIIDTRDSQAVVDAIADLSTEEEVADGNSLELRSEEFLLAWTREEIGLPNYLCARVEGRSTLARLGLSVHQTAPTVHPTFHGPLRLELHNAGPFTLKLYPGQPICQLIVEALSQPAASALSSIHQRQTP